MSSRLKRWNQKEERPMSKPIWVIGGGLAGAEAAWQIANSGWDVILYEMRPVKNTPAHTTPFLAELVKSKKLRKRLGTFKRRAAPLRVAVDDGRC